MINNSFDKYLAGNQKKKVEEISQEINSLYKENEYNLYENQIESYSTLENFTIKIENLDGKVLYSSANAGRNNHMHQNMMRSHRMDSGEYIEEIFPLYQNEKEVGNIVIGYIDNSYLTEGALTFKSTLNKILFLSAIVAITVGIVTSILLAKSLTRPLIQIKNSAVEIQQGNLGKKAQVKTNIVEIEELSNSINYLGDTLSNQENIRKKYASDISHELRTPLTTLKSHVEAIIDGIWEPSREHLLVLMKEINRLSSLVDDLKSSFNSNESGLVLNKSKFDLSKEIEEAITAFKPIFYENNISIEEEIEKDMWVFMDKDKIKQVIYNLLSNCVKYIEGEGELYISLIKKEDHNISITIKDNGIGIDKKHLPYIFDRFYRVDKSRNHPAQGTGLGLAIVKSIVEEHGGQIRVKSIYGEGSEFTINFSP